MDLNAEGEAESLLRLAQGLSPAEIDHFFQSSFHPQGVVAFSSQGDRIALTQIEQMVDGQYHKLGYYDTQADNLTWFNSEQWVGGKVNEM